MKRIFLDMDGVVSDFDSYAQQILGYSAELGGKYPESEWKKLSANPRLYSALPICPGSQEFVTEVSRIAKDTNRELLFLSAVPSFNDAPWAFWDKISWASQHFPGIPVWFGPYSRDKQLHARPGDILIDDRDSNIREWAAAGGIAIQNRADLEDTLRRLKKAI
jgi:5'(3')-deoxyribonucleotidase